jgi:hypothetical protein
MFDEKQQASKQASLLCFSAQRRGSINCLFLFVFIVYMLFIRYYYGGPAPDNNVIYVHAGMRVQYCSSYRKTSRQYMHIAYAVYCFRHVLYTIDYRLKFRTYFNKARFIMSQTDDFFIIIFSYHDKLFFETQIIQTYTIDIFCFWYI